jgi:competence ComEA-like helix-hairpin-helix protein
MPLLSFFQSPRKERVLFTSLVVFTIGITGFRVIKKNYFKPTFSDQEALISAYHHLRDSMEAIEHFPSEITPIQAPKVRFDPNHATLSFLHSLNLPEQVCSNWVKYLRAGGRFYRKEDVGKIYGIEPFYDALAPYMEVESTPKRQKSTPPLPSVSRSTEAKKTSIAHQSIALNQCLPEMLEDLPGIGPVLAHRIIKFRDALGGFHDIGQVADTYGLPPETFHQIQPFLRIDSNQIERINVNDATVQRLAKHPYIGYHDAKLVVKYRNQHGSFDSLEGLKNIYGVDTASIDKLMHYLVLN